MALTVRAEFGDRFEAHVAAVPGGWISASPQALTRWTEAGPAVPVVVEDPLPGPLAWLSRSETLCWGPAVLAGTDPAWPVERLGAHLLADLGDNAARAFSLVVGAVSGGADEIFVVFRRGRSRARGGPGNGATVRTAIVRPDGTVIDSLDDQVPSVVVWGEGDLLLGGPGQLIRRVSESNWRHWDLGDRTVPRSVARGPGGMIAAGTASGAIVLLDLDGRILQSWPAHDGPVTALCFAADQLVTGGTDGWIRLWDRALLSSELRVAGPTLDLAFLDMTFPGADAVAAVVGDSGGTVLLADL